MAEPRPKFIMRNGWRDYGNLSACESWASISMSCEPCKTRWVGCWDNFQCPECGSGDLPAIATEEPKP